VHQNLKRAMELPPLDRGDPATRNLLTVIDDTHHLTGSVGARFTTIPPTRPPAPVLNSLAHFIHQQTGNMADTYAHHTEHGRNVVYTYLAGKLLQHQFMPVLDEDVLDGTLAAHHKAVILTSLDYLDPDVIAGLEDFVKEGGLVLTTADCKVKIKGA